MLLIFLQNDSSLKLYFSPRYEIMSNQPCLLRNKDKWYFLYQHLYFTCISLFFYTPQHGSWRFNRSTCLNYIANNVLYLPTSFLLSHLEIDINSRGSVLYCQPIVICLLINVSMDPFYSCPSQLSLVVQIKSFR